ncbi:MAG TPA: ABC transporter ATP-binding protein [Chloroflexia bacterium]|nr:ABC transporter ATP-binding protein [Chloroflexia bacterium]
MASPTSAAPALAARDIVKQFPGVLANDHVSFELRPGEIHALLGENGAGKSTLMNILYGLYQPDAGQVLVAGEEVHFRNPRDAIARGIGMVHQHFMLVPPLTVTENIMLGQESIRAGVLLDRASAAGRIAELSRQYSLEVNPQAYIRDLSVGAQQRVEILKAFYRAANVLILDEPTAVLTPQEADDLFRIMDGLRAQGKSIVFITHKLREVLAIADRITVLRQGRVVGQAAAEAMTEQELATMMVGRSISLTGDRARQATDIAALGLGEPVAEHALQPQPAAPAILEVRDLRVKNALDQNVVDGVTFTVRPGEIFGIAGVEGNGQEELIEALTGLRPVAAGQVLLAGHDLTSRPPRHMIEAGLGHIPADRQKYGLVLTYPVSDNMVLSTYHLSPFARGIIRQDNAVREFARRLIKAFDVRTPGPEVAAGNLSGGNQQKVIIARELSRPIKLLIAAQPTRGLDVGSIEFIHSQIVAERAAGKAVLLVSAELDEILALADRIGVFYRGKLAAILSRQDATRERLGLLMAGGRDAADPATPVDKELSSAT